jgi:hypothetical protein
MSCAAPSSDSLRIHQNTGEHRVRDDVLDDAPDHVWPPLDARAAGCERKLSNLVT